MTEAGCAHRRTVFIDIDGTLAHHGAVPPAHTAAVRAAIAEGHSLWVCTGRPLSLIPAEVLDLGFAGIVAGAGAQVIHGESVLTDRRFPIELAARTVAAMADAGATFFVEAPEATYAHPRTIAGLLEYADHAPDAEQGDGARQVAQRLTPHDDLAGVRFAKVTSIGGDVPLDEVAHGIGPEVAAIRSSIEGLGPGAGELFLADVTKAVGMEVALAALGAPREDSIAIGDGPNDLAMLDYAAVSVAIDTATDEVTRRADFTVPGPQRDGLVEAFARLGLTPQPGAPSR